jgi:hypothetical protein
VRVRVASFVQDSLFPAESPNVPSVGSSPHVTGYKWSSSIRGPGPDNGLYWKMASGVTGILWTAGGAFEINERVNGQTKEQVAGGLGAKERRAAGDLLFPSGQLLGRKNAGCMASGLVSLASVSMRHFSNRFNMASQAEHPKRTSAKGGATAGPHGIRIVFAAVLTSIDRTTNR